MKRRILIILNPGKTGSATYCDGVYRDKENYNAFFKSAIGGYYSDSEIRTFDKPALTTVRRELQSIENENVDFSIIVFCGHGWYSTISETNILCINDSEQIDSIEFRRNFKKRIIIEDNCREKYAEYVAESERKSFSAILLMDSGGKVLNPELCKYYYNKRIEECPEQLIYSTACNVGETAGDNSSFGGFYSSSLLKETKTNAETLLRNINLNTNYHTFNFPICHENAKPRVRKLSGEKQNPQIEKPRFFDENRYLPFAVIA